MQIKIKPRCSLHRKHRDFILGLFDGTDINKDVLELFSIMANAESKEEYIEAANK